MTFVRPFSTFRPDPDVRFTLVESLVSILAGFRTAMHEAVEAAMTRSSGPKLAGNLGVMLNACWYAGRSLSVLLDDPVFVDDSSDAPLRPPVPEP